MQNIAIIFNYIALMEEGGKKATEKKRDKKMTEERVGVEVAQLWGGGFAQP